MELAQYFDDEYYLNLYPDVEKAINKGLFNKAYDHYRDFGEKEGRKALFHLPLENKLTNHVVSEIKKINTNLLIELVPEEFRPIQNIEYPEGNKIPFERYFTGKILELRPFTRRIYIPIHWTAYYVNHKYGTDKKAIIKLQTYIDSLDKDKQYFTIIQYDDGILNDVSSLDLLVYSMGCKKPGYYPIPLISQPLNNSPSEIENKPIAYSFSGLNNHPIRVDLIKALNNEYVCIKLLPIKKYYDILKKSVFALCPRGYGITSFRMFEAMHFGCIPVYISDDFWEPFNLPFTEYGIKILPEQIKDIPEILEKANIDELRRKGKEYYENYFVYSRCFDSIIKTLQ
jgi:hypothetical protein